MLSWRDLVARQLAGVAAVAQHRHAVGDALHLRRAGARCRATATPAAFRSSITSKSRSVSRCGEAGRRLVHDEDAGVQRQRRAISTSCCSPAAGRRRRARATRPGRRGRAAAARASSRAVEPAEQPPRRRLAAEEEVGGDVRFSARFSSWWMRTMPRAMASATPAKRTGWPSSRTSPASGVDAGEDLHQRGLAGPVLADDGQHLAGGDAQRHAVERQHAGELLARRRGLRGGAAGVHGCAQLLRPSRRLGRFRPGEADGIAAPAAGSLLARQLEVLAEGRHVEDHPVLPASLVMTRVRHVGMPSAGEPDLSPLASAAIILTDS